MELKYFIGMATDGDEGGTTTFCLVELGSERVMFINTEDDLMALVKKIPGGWKGKITFDPPKPTRGSDRLTVRYYSSLSPPVRDRFETAMNAQQ